eukprot:PITA_11701
MKIISWNCRGMGSKIKEEAIRNLIRIEAPDILLLQETKMEEPEFLQRGGSIVRYPAREWVEDLLQDWDLLDIKPVSGMFTWSNKRIGPGHIATRLDRFLVHSSFLLLDLDASMHILPCSTSDHKPIKLTLRDHVDLGPIPFKFSPLWIKEPNFLQVVKESWSHLVTRSPFYIWEEKLRRLKSALKHWAKSIANPAAERKNIQS